MAVTVHARLQIRRENGEKDICVVGHIECTLVGLVSSELGNAMDFEENESRSEKMRRLAETMCVPCKCERKLAKRVREVK